MPSCCLARSRYLLSSIPSSREGSLECLPSSIQGGRLWTLVASRFFSVLPKPTLSFDSPLVLSIRNCFWLITHPCLRDHGWSRRNVWVFLLISPTLQPNTPAPCPSQPGWSNQWNYMLSLTKSYCYSSVLFFKISSSHLPPCKSNLSLSCQCSLPPIPDSPSHMTMALSHWFMALLPAPAWVDFPSLPYSSLLPRAPGSEVHTPELRCLLNFMFSPFLSE